MTKVYGWKAKRAGAGMTISGTDAEGLAVKLTRIVSIEGDRADGPVAVQDNGAAGVERFQLA